MVRLARLALGLLLLTLVGESVIASVRAEPSNTPAKSQDNPLAQSLCGPWPYDKERKIYWRNSSVIVTSKDMPRLIHIVDQEFPTLAAGERGAWVSLVADIAPNGNVMNVRIENFEPKGFGFETASKDALSQWRFAPGPKRLKDLRFCFEFDPGVNALASGPQPVVQISPDYPELALRNEIEGLVTLEIDITRDGSVTNVRLVDVTPKGYGFETNAIGAV